MKTTLLALATFGVLAFAVRPAQADTNLVALNSTASAGGTGFFDVLLTESRASAQVSGFSFELSVPGTSGVQFTDATMGSASTYLFQGNSFDAANGLTLSTSTFPTTDLIASDVANTGSTLVAPGDTFGLGRVAYQVAPGTPSGPITVSFESIGGATSLSDENANAIPFATQNGTITVGNVSAAPEPSEWATLALCAAGVAAIWLRRKRRAAH